MFEKKKIILLITVFMFFLLAFVLIYFIVNYGALSLCVPNNITDCPCGSINYMV